MVVASVAPDRVVPGPAADVVVAALAADDVVATLAVDGVVAVAADDHVVVRRPVDEGGAALTGGVQPGMAGRLPVAQPLDGPGRQPARDRRAGQQGGDGQAAGKPPAFPTLTLVSHRCAPALRFRIACARHCRTAVFSSNGTSREKQYAENFFSKFQRPSPCDESVRIVGFQGISVKSGGHSSMRIG